MCEQTTPVTLQTEIPQETAKPKPPKPRRSVLPGVYAEEADDNDVSDPSGFVDDPEWDTFEVPDTEDVDEENPVFFSHRIPKGRYLIATGAIVWVLSRTKFGHFEACFALQTIHEVETEFHPRVIESPIINPPDEFDEWVILNANNNFVLVKNTELIAISE